jgi:pimeloyl-ACP methyl ester carboxylesterase
MTAIADEIAVFAETIEQVQATGSLGDLPLTVLTATGSVWWPDLPPDVDASQFRQMWLELQQDLTKLSTNSTQVFADKSSHFMQFDQPEVIVDAIRQIVETTR